MAYILSILIAWGIANSPYQPISVQDPGFTPSKLIVDLWVVSHVTHLGENLNDNPVPMVFGQLDGEARCSATLRGSLGLLGAPGAQLWWDVTHATPTTVYELEPFDGVLDFAGPSGITQTYVFVEHRRITETNPNVIARVLAQDSYWARIGWYAGTVYGNGATGTTIKNGARVKLTFAR